MPNDEFDPEGRDYDYATARASGGKPDSLGHWGSLDPGTGMVLKGRNHPTWDLMLEEEEKLNNSIIQRDGRYYSVADDIEAPSLKGRNWDDIWPAYQDVKAMDWKNPRSVGNVQMKLQDLGYYGGEIDSVGGKGTRTAVDSFISDANQKEGLAWFQIKNLGDHVKNLFTGDDD